MHRPIPPLPRAGATPWALVCLALTMLMSSLGTSITNVALPTLVETFDAPFNAVQWVVLAYLLAVTTLVVSVGRLGDLVGRRRLMMAGITVFTVASAGCAASSELWMLVVARAAQGLGAAAMMVLTMALVGDAVPRERAGRAMGFLGTMSAVGTALGPSLGGGLIAALGWPSIFLVNVPFGLLALAFAYRFLPIDRNHGNRPAFDHLGSVLLALALGAYALSMTLGRGSSGAARMMLLCVALVASGLFVIAMSRNASPLVRLELFRNRVVGTGFAMSGLVATIAMTTLVVGPFHLSGALGLDTASVGMAMTSGPLVAALVGVPAGRGVDRYGAHRMAVAGLMAMTAGCAAMSVSPVALGIAGYVLPLVTVTAGFAVFQAANNTAVVTGVEASQRGLVSGLLNLSRNLGLVTGASAMGAVFALATGAPDVATAGPGAIASGTHAAFAVAALLAGAALGLAIGSARPAAPATSNT